MDILKTEMAVVDVMKLTVKMKRKNLPGAGSIHL